MSAPKPHIKPKAGPLRQHTDPPDRDVPVRGAWDPPVFTEHDGHDDDAEQNEDGTVLYYEDDCLR
jgi:hypothetical protein